MNVTEALNKIKLIFSEEPAPEQVAFGTEYKLEDGTPIMIDKLEAGGVAKIGDMVAPDGQHTLEDGTVFEVKDGIIIAVAPKAQEPMTDEKKIEIELGNIKKQFEAVHEQLTVLSGNFEKVSVKAETQAKANEELIKLVEFLAEQPIKQPEQKPVDFEKLTPLEKFRLQKQNQN